MRRLVSVLEVEFEVAGLPIPQGSKKAFVVGKRAVVVDVNKDALRAWRDAVAAAAAAAYEGRPTLDEPVALEVIFRLPRPASVSPEVRLLPSVAPDLDKLQRAVFDALTKSGVIRDDSRVVRVGATKFYGLPGVAVRVSRVVEEEQ